MKDLTNTDGKSSSLQSLLGSLCELIRDARARAMRTDDEIQVQTCWQIGRHIVEFEQGGAARATYGQRLLPELAKTLATEFGKGFDERNLRHMRNFFQSFPIWAAVRTELSWTHYRTLLRVDGDAARQWYMREAVTQNWSTRVLDRQIGTHDTPHGRHHPVQPERRVGGAIFRSAGQRATVRQQIQTDLVQRGRAAR